jgi:hypothetical protein
MMVIIPLADRFESMVMTGVFQLGEVFGGVLFELGNAGITAEFDFPAFVSDDDRIAHGAEFFLGDDASFERIGFDACFCGGCCGGGLLFVAGDRCDDYGGERDEDDFHGCDLE